MPCNVSRHLRTAACRTPLRKAVVLPSGKYLSFSQLDAAADAVAAKLYANGVRQGMRVAVLVRPGFDFVPAVYGCFRLGAVPVFVDPGMRFKNILTCLRQASPSAILASRWVLLVSLLFRHTFATVRHRVALPHPRKSPFPPPPHATGADDTAAILFTSGSTGIPKGVVYRHTDFDHQQRLLRETYQIADDEIDLVVFPLFALFAAAWGITAVIPRMNPARPARASGKHLARVIRQFGVTHTAGSPAIWKNLGAYCAATGTTLASLRRILMAGAQVPENLVRQCAKLARSIHTPYGATEALPLTEISHPQLFASYPKTRAGKGTCVGRPLAGVDIAIIPPDDDCDHWEDSRRLPAHAIGEIAVKAPWVTREYFGNPRATRRAKITDGNAIWHRMGDMGYLDEQGALWFCGRKDHRLAGRGVVHYPDPIEAIFDYAFANTRTAVVNVAKHGRTRTVLVAEGPPLSDDQCRAFLAFAATHPAQPPIDEVTNLEKFPVDVRHNIKIDRPRIAAILRGQT